MEKTLSTLDRLHGKFSRTLVHDDSGDQDYHNWLGQFGYELATTERVGFTKAMISAWQKLKEDSNEWVFHLEEDFLILDDVYIDNMIEVLKSYDYLKEMVLLRQPIGDHSREQIKGGIIASHPERYEDKTDGVNYWVEHRVGFSCNPCLYQKSLVYKYPWPDMLHSEREFGRLLFRDTKSKCAYWGKSTDKPVAMHIGHVRSGFNY